MPITLKCEQCGRKYQKPLSKRERSRFCSKTCLQLWMSINYRSIQQSPWLKDVDNTPKHPNKRRAKRTTYKRRNRELIHRRVARYMLLHPVPPGYEVHHCDGNRHNNAKNNLRVLTSHEHRLVEGYIARKEKPVNLTKRRPYKYRTKPYKHQHRALRQMLFTKQGGALFMEMGTGKTKVAIDYCCALAQRWRQDDLRVLVICPKSVLSVWPKEIKRHAPTKHHQPEWRITNYDRIASRAMDRGLVKGELDQWLEWDPYVLILDESHKVKNPTAKRTQAIKRIADNAEYVLLLSGTPIANNPLDLFAQYRMVDETIFGTTWTRFKRRYAVWGGYGGYTITRFQHLDDLRKRIRPITFEVTKAQCLDLPARTHEIINVDLSSEARAIYTNMATKALVTIKDHEFAAPIVLTQLLRLSQITGGFISSKVDGERKTVSLPVQDKLDTFDNFIGDLSEQGQTKIVVFCRFLAELKALANICANHDYKVLPFHGAVNERAREQRLMTFSETTDKTVFLSQISTGSLGIDLTAANVAIFFSHTHSFAEFEQACDRLHRLGQRHPVTYYHFIVNASIDETVWLSLRTKKQLAGLVLRNLDQLRFGATGEE